MNQKRYIKKLLIRFGMAECKPKVTPTTLGLDKGVGSRSLKVEDPTLYQPGDSWKRILIHAMTGIKPNLCYIVTRLSQNVFKPIEGSLIAAKHISKLYIFC